MSSGSARTRIKLDFTRASFICPLCSLRTSSERIDQHRALHHAELTEAGYLAELRLALQAGGVRFELSGRAETGSSGTKLVAEASRTEKAGVRLVVLGGSPGLRKRRS
jgi:hypothetical protein